MFFLTNFIVCLEFFKQTVRFGLIYSQKRPLPKKRKVESSKKTKLDVAISADTSGHDTSTTTTTTMTADMSGHETSDKSHNTSHDTSGDDVLHDVRRQGEEPEKEDKKERSRDGEPGKSEERPGGDPQQDPSTRCGQTEREMEEVPHSDFLWRDISQEDGMCCWFKGLID